MENLTHYLATTLRTLRHQREWSLSRLAEETGVSKAMLGQIERNESSPTVATLWKIATGLNVPFSTFISPPQSDGALQHYDPQQQAMVDHAICFRGTHSSASNTSRYSWHPAHSANRRRMRTGVIEHVVVIDGQLDLCVEGAVAAAMKSRRGRCDFAADRRA